MAIDLTKKDLTDNNTEVENNEALRQEFNEFTNEEIEMICIKFNITKDELKKEWSENIRVKPSLEDLHYWILEDSKRDTLIEHIVKGTGELEDLTDNNYNYIQLPKGEVIFMYV